MFAIIQGLYILKEDEEENIERKRQKKYAHQDARQRNRSHIVQPRTGTREEAKCSPQKQKARGTGEGNRKSRVR
jgi:hypothetical protein